MTRGCWAWSKTVGASRSAGLRLDQRADGAFLIGADFQDQVAARFQEADRFLDQPGNHVQPAGPAVKGHSWLVIADSRLEMFDRRR